jgi:transcriptional regulator with XRE-family HTH domain
VKRLQKQHNEDPAVVPIGTRIRRLRTDRGLSQKEVALGVPQNYIAGVESGQINPSAARLRAIANGLKLPFEQLVVGTDADPKVLESHSTAALVWCPNKHCSGADYVMHETEKIEESVDPAIIDRSIYLAEYVDGAFKVGVKGFHSFPAVDDDGSPNVFCPFCGTSLVSKCQCGRRISSGNQRHCMRCGKRIWDAFDPDEGRDPVAGEIDHDGTRSKATLPARN